MNDPDTGNRQGLTDTEAADYLSVPPATVRALVDAGYLAALPDGSLARPDLKAFLARNADNGSGNLADALAAEVADPQELLAALDGKADEMAQRAYEVFAAAFPEAARWSAGARARFIESARTRFEAILAVTGQGAEVDEALVGDLQGVGAGAAWDGSPLPELLVVLRISRDLVVQTAVELAEARGRHWGLALSLLLTRILPAIDRLTDSLAQGYWAAVLGREEEDRARYQHVVENASDGVYEVDQDGSIQYANPALAVILGRRPEDLDGASLADLLHPLEPGPGVAALLRDSDRPAKVEMTVLRPDGVRRVLDITTVARYSESDLAGFQGIVRDVTAAHDLEAERGEFVALVAFDLRNPLTTVLGLGATLETHAAELPPDRVARMGATVRRHAERMARLADDLYDVSRIEAKALLLHPRPVGLRRVVNDSLVALADMAGVEVAVAPGIEVLADPRRLEQVVANLVENGLEHGAAPVVVSARAADPGHVELRVTDAGPGLPADQVPTLFSRLHALSRGNRDRSRGTGMGLALVSGLVEAMGGRVWYSPGSNGGASFHVTLPVPRSR